MFSEEFYMYVIKEYERKLKEYMSEDEYTRFSIWVSKNGFRQEVENMEDGEFKNFILENFDTITNEGEDLYYD